MPWPSFTGRRHCSPAVHSLYSLLIFGYVTRRCFIFRKLTDSCFPNVNSDKHAHNLLEEYLSSSTRKHAHIVGAAVGLTYNVSHIRDHRLSCALDQNAVRLPLSMHALSSSLPTSTTAVMATMYQCWRREGTITVWSREEHGKNGRWGWWGGRGV